MDAELDTEGNLILLSRSNAITGWRNAKFTGQVSRWLQAHPEFEDFGPSAGYTLSNGAVRSPDASLLQTAA